MDNRKKIEINLNGQFADIHIVNEKCNHSFIYSLLTASSTDRIDNEIARVSNDIKNCEAVELIQKTFDVAIEIIRTSYNEDNIVERLITEYKITEKQARFVSELPLRDLTDINYSVLIKNLKKALDYLKYMEKYYFSKKK